MDLPKIKRLDLRPNDFFAKRARYEWQSYEWMLGAHKTHPGGYSGARFILPPITDQGYHLPIQNYMLEYYSAYQ